MQWDATNISMIAGMGILGARSFGFKPIELARKLLSRGKAVIDDVKPDQPHRGVTDVIPPDGFAEHVGVVLSNCTQADPETQLSYLADGLTAIETLQAEKKRLEAATK